MTALLRILDRRNDAIYVIVKQVLVAESSSNLTNHRSLAGVCWRKFDSERPPNSTLVGAYRKFPWTTAKFYETLSRCRSEFFTLKRNARSYVAQPAVIEWLANQPPNQGNWNYTRQHAVDTVWSPSTRILRPRWGVAVPSAISNLKPYELLLSRDFVKLLKIHQYYFSQRSSTNVH